ncbi:hypothetical protein II906_05370, partial [bacterium]|nr:hypothetical protein [bacterium]
MILFLTQYDNPKFKKFIEQFSNKYGIKYIYKTADDILKNSSISIKCVNNEFEASIDNIDINDLKFCYINSSFQIYNCMFDYDDKYDNEYAAEEWSATLTCLLNAN